MFFNLYKYRLISIIRNYQLMIWTLIFPIILATLFHFAFSTLDYENQFHPIEIGVVDDEAFKDDLTFSSTIEALSKNNDDQMFITSYVSAEEASDLLNNSKIEGFIQIADEKPALFIKENGLNQTILKCFLDQYIQTYESIKNIVTNNPEAVSHLKDFFDTKTFTKEVSLTKNPQTDVVGYYYSLMAMLCLYGGFLGFECINYLQANLSALGARRTIASTKRFTVIISDLLATITAQFACSMIVSAYLVFVLHVNLGTNPLLVILTCLAGCTLGVSFGAMVSSCCTLKQGAKTAIIIGVTMVCCFMSGLMVSGINYTIMKKAPVVSWLNPAARISDAFYCLYYYDNYGKYFLNIGIIAIMSAVLILITVFFVRRLRYESI